MAYLSVEQFELIRRIRNSGIEKNELVSAFDQFDEIERTFGDIYSIPVSKASNTQNNAPNTQNNVPNTPNIAVNTQNNTPVLNRNLVSKARPKRGPEMIQPVNNPPPKRVERFSNIEENGSSHTNNTLKQPIPTQSSNPSPLPSSVSDVILPHFSRNGLTISAVSTSHNTSSTEESNWGSANITKLKKSEEVKSEEEMLSEIRKFLIKHSLKLSTISEMANLSASHVRNYVHGNLSIIPEETKQRIYAWYQANKNNSPVVQSDSDTTPFKRDRNVFRNVHIRILEDNFKVDAFPDNHKKEYIVEECNHEYSEELGVQTLDQRDRLNITHVASWFHNRRKDTRRPPIKRGPHPNSNVIENSQILKMSDGFEGMASPPAMETQDVKPNISEMLTSSSITTPPSYSSAEDTESFMGQENEFIPIQNIKQEPPDN